MSMKLMVRVLEEADVTRPQQAVLLAMAENAWDDGSHCYPSVDLIAWKAGYKPRNVVDIIRQLKDMNVLEEVNGSTRRRGTEYLIRLDNAPRKPTFAEWQADNGRHNKTYSKQAQPEANAPVPFNRGAISRAGINGEGCNLTSSGVQSRVNGVQSHVINTRETAPRTVSEPSEPVKEPVYGEQASKAKTFPTSPAATPKPNSSRRKPSTTFPDTFTVNGAPMEYALKTGLNEDRARLQFERFRNWAIGKDERKSDWMAAWRNWVLGEIERNGASPKPKDPNVLERGLARAG